MRTHEYLHSLLYSKAHNLIIAIFISLSSALSAQTKVIYKQIDTVSLSMDVYYPAGSDRDQARTAIVFFFGGGWVNRSLTQFQPHAEYFAERGAVCFVADYRIKSR